MRRILVLGRGGAGKSTLARRLAAVTGLPLTELDRCFWNEGSIATPPAKWVDAQRELIRPDAWILDGDLGPHDVLEPRLEAADTVIILDFSLARCAWRSVTRAREGTQFWRWVLTYRRRSLPALLAMTATCAPRASVRVLRTPGEVETFLHAISSGHSLQR